MKTVGLTSDLLWLIYMLSKLLVREGCFRSSVVSLSLTVPGEFHVSHLGREASTDGQIFWESDLLSKILEVVLHHVKPQGS